MKTTLLALNSSYSHTSLAARYLQAACRSAGQALSLVEMTVNERAEAVSRAVFATRPDVLACSVYIWNVRMMSDICIRMKLLIPGLAVVWGGPEVMGDEADLRELYPFVDMFCAGEGESVFPALLSELASGRKAQGMRSGEPTDMDLLPDPYSGYGGLENNRLYYFETSRGCPYSCAYCISSSMSGVRFMPESLVLDRVRMLAAELPLIKFVDRTFNADGPRARRLWQGLTSIEGSCRYHCEVCAHLLTEEDFTFLAGPAADRLQFEVGLQSTWLPALTAVNRRIEPQVVLNAVRRLVSLGTVEVHLDLIAGLPGEGCRQFLSSFEQAMSCRPHRLHLGFLKLLPGTDMRAWAAEYGMRYLPFAPYEVLATGDISAEELLSLKNLEEGVELYYNSRRFVHTVSALLDTVSPVQLFSALAGHPAREADRALYDAAVTSGMAEVAARELVLLDFLLREPHRAPPGWLAEGIDEQAMLREIVYGDKEQLHRALPHRQGHRAGLVLRDLRLCVLSAPVRDHLGLDESSRCFLIDHGQPARARLFPVAGV